MELNEITWKWLIIGALAVIFLSYRTISKVLEQRRRAWVDGLATAFGTTAAHGSDATSRFDVDVKGRRCEIAHGYRSRTGDGRYIRGCQLIVVVPLRHVSDIYSISFKLRDGKRTEHSLSLTDSGYHPRDGWLSNALRDAIFDFYEFVGERKPLTIQGGSLMSVTSARVSAERLRRMVEHQHAVATKIEVAL